MSGTTQPTPIDEAEYERFKQFVQDAHGTVRGNLRTEIENALREYRQDDGSPDKLARIEQDVATMKAMLADAEADGGATPDTVSEQCTHAHADTTKPAPNAPRSAKVNWIIDEYYGPTGETHTNAITNQIQDEFGFDDRTAKEYVELILTELDAEPHPQRGNTYLWGERLSEAIEEHREELENEADEKL